VFTLGADPVVQGLVASLNRPGANVTGVGLLAQEIEPKRIELLRELVPQASTIAFLANPASASMALSIQNLQAASQAVRQHIIIMNGELWRASIVLAAI
jgi:putative tryptophan/tyrosine transport system substrate-binding protein